MTKELSRLGCLGILNRFDSSLSELLNDKNDGLNCDGDQICSTEFRYITVALKYSSDSSNVALSEYKVIRVSDSTDITHYEKIYYGDSNFNAGLYLITSDTFQDMYRGKDVEVEFQGFIDGTCVVKSRYVITADCCHISLVSGETEIYLTRV